MKDISAKEYAKLLSSKFKKAFIKIKEKYHTDELPEWKIKQLLKEGKCYSTYDFYSNSEVFWKNKGDGK